MTTHRSLLTAAALLAGGLLVAGSVNFAGHSASAMVSADSASATPTVTATDTPGSGDTPIPGPTGEASPTPGTPTATFVPARSPVPLPTPIPPAHQHIKLPKPVVVEVGAKIEGQGLSKAAALTLANKYITQFLIVTPSYVPKGFTLQWVHVDPSLDQQTPPSSWLQYTRTDLKKTSGQYANFRVDKEQGTAVVINPGAKPQAVVINKGVKGAGVVKGTLVDIKLKNGAEIVTISWSHISISYDVTSNITVSKLSVQELLKVAASAQ